jgi:hypothetical protein
MAILNDADLQDLGDLFEDLAFKDDCTIKRTVRSSNYGETEEKIVIGEVKCMMQRPSASTLQAYGNRFPPSGIPLAWHVSTPLGTDIDVNDTLIIKNQEMIVQVLFDAETWMVSTDVLASGVNQS